MYSQIHFTGPPRYRIRSTAKIAELFVKVSLRHAFSRSHRQGWSWFVELCTQVLKTQVTSALEMDIREARRYLNSVHITSPALAEVAITPVTEEKFRGHWFNSNSWKGDVTLLYFHGGGYSFYPRPYENIISLIARAADARTFALDYPLAPEHRFPAQLHNAVSAYRWLLDSGTDPENLIVGGDSAGGNLTLALLLAVRDAQLPLPALAIALSPPTNFEAVVEDSDSDWIDRRALLQWADWFCGSAERCDPLISALRANLQGLPPIYMQAGTAEILFNSIQAFADYAATHGADVMLESWKDMPHVFQVFGPDVPQSAEALRRIGEVIDSRVRSKRAQTVRAK